MTDIEMFKIEEYAGYWLVTDKERYPVFLLNPDKQEFVRTDGDKLAYFSTVDHAKTWINKRTIGERGVPPLDLEKFVRQHGNPVSRLDCRFQVWEINASSNHPYDNDDYLKYYLIWDSVKLECWTTNYMANNGFPLVKYIQQKLAEITAAELEREANKRGKYAPDSNLSEEDMPF